MARMHITGQITGRSFMIGEADVAEFFLKKPHKITKTLAWSPLPGKPLQCAIATQSWSELICKEIDWACPRRGTRYKPDDFASLPDMFCFLLFELPHPDPCITATSYMQVIWDAAAPQQVAQIQASFENRPHVRRLWFARHQGRAFWFQPRMLIISTSSTSSLFETCGNFPVLWRLLKNKSQWCIFMYVQRGKWQQAMFLVSNDR